MLVALLALAYAPALPVNAQTQAVTVYTEVVSTNNVIYFEVNLTYLRSALGWVGSTVDLYLSTNGYATISSGDIKVNTQPLYVATDDYIAGTIVINQTVVNELLNGNSGYLFLKITDGSNTAASNRFYVVTNVTDVIKMNTLKLSYVNNTIVGSQNYFTFFANLTGITTINLTTVNINVTLVAGTAELAAFTYPAGDLANATSAIFNLTYKNVTADTVAFNGSLLDFALPVYNAVTTVEGVPVNYTQFLITVKAINTTLINLTSVFVIENSQVVGSKSSYTLENVTLNVGSINTTVDVFPSIEITATNATIAGTATDLNPGDTMNITIHQFMDKTNVTLVTCFFNQNTGVKTASVSIVTNVTNGTASFQITIPEAPFGGQPQVVAVKEIDQVIRGLPAPTTVVVKPYLNVSFVYNNGTFSAWNKVNVTAPGDYVLIKGYGFLQNDSIVVSTYYNGSYVDNLAVVLDYDGDTNLTVQTNGTFFAIFRMPVPANTSITNFTLVAHGQTPGDTGTSLITLNYTTGKAVAKVFVNPEPAFIAALQEPSSAMIEQMNVTEGYPYEVPWQTGGARLFCLEIIGVDFATGYAALNQTTANYFNATVNATGNVEFTTTQGYFRAKFRIPVAPYGAFNVTVFNASNTNDNYTTDKPRINIENTLRAIDPVLLQINGTVNYTTVIFLGKPVNFTVVGYGWPAGAQLNMTVTKNGKVVNESVLVTAVPANGYINTTVPLAPILEASGNGTYTVTIYDVADPNINATITVFFNITPPLSVKVYTGTVKLVKPGDTVDVYIVLNLGTVPANATELYKSKVLVTVYYYENNTLEVYLTKEATYTGVPGIWATSFVVNNTLKNKDLLIKVTATVQPKFYNVPQTQADYVSLTVAGGLQDLLDNILNAANSINMSISDLQTLIQNLATTLNNVNAQLTTINGQLVVIAQQMSEGMQQVLMNLAQLQALLATVQANVSLILVNTQMMQENMMNMSQQVMGQLGQLALEISAYGENITLLLNTTLDKLDAVITSVNNGVATLSTLIGNVTMNLTDLIKAMNASITGLICTKSKEMMVLVQTAEGNITATLKTAEEMLMNNITVNAEALMKSVAAMNKTMQAQAMKILDELGMLNTTVMNSTDMLEKAITEAKGATMVAIANAAKQITSAVEKNATMLEGQVQSLQNLVNNSSAQIVSLVKQTDNDVKATNNNVAQVSKKVDDINTKLSDLQNTITTQLNNLQKTVQENNNTVKSRVTTMTGISTIILLAAILGVGFLGRKT